MPRSTRPKSQTGIYHVMLRGINRQQIFIDDEDKERFVETVKRFKKESCYEVYAYCLMNNHVHLLLKESSESIGQVMKRICGSYVYWYNRKYGRIGHLFQERFRSEAVEDQEYFLTVFRYIHQNPLKAGVSQSLEKWEWSSYHDYFGRRAFIADTGFILELFSKDLNTARQQLLGFINADSEDKCMDLD